MLLRKFVCGFLGCLMPLTLAMAQNQTVPAGTPVTITVKPAEAAGPNVTIKPLSRQGHGTPNRCGFTHTGGGNIDVQQPSADTLVITLGAVAVAGPHPFKDSSASMDFDINQCFVIEYANKDVKGAKLSLEGQVVGLLRSDCKGGGSAQESASAAVMADAHQLLTLAMPGHSVSCGENLTINDVEGPVCGPVGPGKYTLHANFHVGASHPKGLIGKAASAEFAADALDPLWISAWEPFKGAAKANYGFKLTLKVEEVTVEEAAPVEPAKVEKSDK